MWSSFWPAVGSDIRVQQRSTGWTLPVRPPANLVDSNAHRNAHYESMVLKKYHKSVFVMGITRPPLSPNAFLVLNAGSQQQCVLSELLSGTIITSVQRCFRGRGPAPCVDRKGSFYDKHNYLISMGLYTHKKNILMNSVLLDATKITPTAALR